MALLQWGGVAELLRALPLLRALLAHGAQGRFRLARTVCSCRHTHFRGLEEVVEALACQRTFFVSPKALPSRTLT